MSEKLKPCPFCGGTNIHIKDNRTWSYICCYECLASFWQQEACNVVETGEVFPSLGECARAIKGDAGNISRCLHTDKSDTHKGFHFERVVQYE